MFNMSKCIPNKEHSRTTLIFCFHLKKTSVESDRLRREAHGLVAPLQLNGGFARARAHRYRIIFRIIVGSGGSRFRSGKNRILRIYNQTRVRLKRNIDFVPTNEFAARVPDNTFTVCAFTPITIKSCVDHHLVTTTEFAAQPLRRAAENLHVPRFSNDTHSPLVPSN